MIGDRHDNSVLSLLCALALLLRGNHSKWWECVFLFKSSRVFYTEICNSTSWNCLGFLLCENKVYEIEIKGLCERYVKNFWCRFQNWEPMMFGARKLKAGYHKATDTKVVFWSWTGIAFTPMAERRHDGFKLVRLNK